MPLEAFDSSASLLGAINGGITRVGRALLVNAGNTQARAVNNLDTGFSERISKALSKLDEASTSPEIERLRRDQDQLIIKKERINNAAGLLNKTISQIQFLKSHIKHLEDEVAKFENSEITSVELANDWDNKIRKINQIVMNADFTFNDSGVSYTKNLLNSSSRTTFSTQRFYAPITPNGAALEIKGAYLGTDWFITDKVTGTLFWNSDTGFLSSEEATGTLTEYTSAVTFPGSPTGRTEDIGSQASKTATVSGNLTKNTVKFRTSSNNEAMQFDLSRGGLGLLDAWAYKFFDGSQRLIRSKEDLNEAESKILLAEAQFRSDLNVVQSRINFFENGIDNIENDIAELVSTSLTREETAIKALQLQFQVAQFDFNLLAARGDTLIRSLILAEDGFIGGPGSSNKGIGDAILGATLSIDV